MVLSLGWSGVSWCSDSRFKLCMPSQGTTSARHLQKSAVPTGLLIGAASLDQLSRCCLASPLRKNTLRPHKCPHQPHCFSSAFMGDFCPNQSVQNSDFPLTSSVFISQHFTIRKRHPFPFTDSYIYDYVFACLSSV